MGGAFGEMMMAAIGGVVCFVVVKEVMNGQNVVLWYEKWPPCQATDMVKKPNSVNPKLLKHGNTELNSVETDKCVETMGFPTLMVDDIVRTCMKIQELSRNVVVALKKCGNRLQVWNAPSFRQSYRYWRLSVSSSQYLRYSNA